MKPATTVRQELESYLIWSGLTRQQFSEMTGINQGTISAILSGYRQISIHNLDLITEGMGLEEGALYEIYLEECLRGMPLHWRRLGPFIRRCAELNKLGCLKRLVQAVADRLSYMPVLFEMAEQFFREGKRKAAALLYQCVAECEKYQHSERLALSRYRLFTIHLGEDQEENLRAAVLFEDYVDRLDEGVQLDALKDLADVYASLHRWDRVESLAEKLEQKATIQYRHRVNRKRKEAMDKGASRTELFYLLYAYLLRANVCDARQEYARALEYVTLYSGGALHGIDVKDEEEQRVVEQFQEWGRANAYVYRLMSGDIQVLADYTEWVASHVQEVVPAMYRILQAANQFELNVDHLLERFGAHLTYKERSCRFGHYNTQIVADQYVRYLWELAQYEFRTRRVEMGVRQLFEGMELALRFNHESMLIRYARLFEQFRHEASREVQEKYKYLFCEVEKSYEIKSIIVDRA
ncbi:helix-turn-helix domain-containing protein [Paenibacillus sp. MB22_1]|uniref:helix-turn-helix domain-containing protein n=3 Tax=Paenibacillus TaxID=44249 RepID=UPI0001AFCBAC|nr:helix-turn-helix transcriptional regulator [Paenibacillus sp. oral taxon 786]EES74477.1 DNA-binding helix-turn-helix protein [Paenibacillus sp. oral taxon 786 str. D14]